MLNTISDHLKGLLNTFSHEDALIFQNKRINIDRYNFKTIPTAEEKTISFIDGGQAEIFNSGNMCVTFFRIVSIQFKGLTKVANNTHEFYLVTHSSEKDGEIEYVSTLFSTNNTLLCDPKDLQILSNDPSIRDGSQRAPIEKVANMARRFCELRLAQMEASNVDFVLLDGTLEQTYNSEEKYLAGLPRNVCSLAKTCSLITKHGNNPSSLLSNVAPNCAWTYHVDKKTYFCQLHHKAKHVFRFEGDLSILQSILDHASDSLFLGYPYGLIFADKLARISNKEKEALRMQFLFRKENLKIREYLSATNAHDILDSIG
jgi:hypothetical protein